MKDAPGVAAEMTLNREPHWTWQSPDGQFFVSWASDSFRPREKAPRRALFSLFLGRTDGSGPTRVLAPLCEEAVAWSPDSKRLAFTVTSVDVEEGVPARGLPQTSRIYVIAIDGTADDLIFERSGYWQPEDWSPDGKKLLLLHSEAIGTKLMRSDMVELDMSLVELSKERAKPGEAWTRAMARHVEPIVGDGAAAAPHGGRYSPDGRFIAVTAFPKAAKPSEWKAGDFELGIIDRTDASYRKIAWHPSGLRGPICWSPDSQWIVFSRPLSDDDLRESSQDPKALGQENGLGLWAIKPDGTGERFLTTGWSPDWR
jgi:Tol biopolymer transport system component